MKKIGILFGQENTFPPAFVEAVNKKAGGEMQAEFVLVRAALDEAAAGLEGAAHV